MLQKKMSIERYQDTEFMPGDAPCRTTIIRNIRKGKLKGEKVGGKWFVIVNLSTGDKVADRAMERFGYGTTAQA